MPSHQSTPPAHILSFRRSAFSLHISLFPLSSTPQCPLSRLPSHPQNSAYCAPFRFPLTPLSRRISTRYLQSLLPLLRCRFLLRLCVRFPQCFRFAPTLPSLQILLSFPSHPSPLLRTRIHTRTLRRFLLPLLQALQEGSLPSRFLGIQSRTFSQPAR